MSSTFDALVSLNLDFVVFVSKGFSNVDELLLIG